MQSGRSSTLEARLDWMLGCAAGEGRAHTHTARRLCHACCTGCSCEPSIIDADTGGDRVSPIVPEVLHLTIEPGSVEKLCELHVAVLESTTSGGHRFKVVGVVLVNSRYTGAISGFDHPGLGLTTRGPV